MMSSPALKRGEALYALQRYKEAAKQFRQSLAEDPALARAHTMLGLCLLKLGEAAAAIDEASQAVALAPEDDYASYVGAFINRRTGHFDDSLSFINKALRLVPDSAAYHAEAALCYLATKSTRRARQESDLSIKLAPTDADACFASAWILYWTGYAAEAEFVLVRSLNANPEADESHWLKGKILFDKKDFSGAFKHLREALRLSPNSQAIESDYVKAKKLTTLFHRIILEVQTTRIRLRLHPMIHLALVIILFVVLTCFGRHIQYELSISLCFTWLFLIIYGIWRVFRSSA